MTLDFGWHAAAQQRDLPRDPEHTGPPCQGSVGIVFRWLVRCFTMRSC
jgi:hypothetical protein